MLITIGDAIPQVHVSLLSQNCFPGFWGGGIS